MQLAPAIEAAPLSGPLYPMLWVAVEVIDACWTPPAGFRGDAEYRFCPVDEPRVAQ